MPCPHAEIARPPVDRVDLAAGDASLRKLASEKPAQI